MKKGVFILRWNVNIVSFDFQGGILQKAKKLKATTWSWGVSALALGVLIGCNRMGDKKVYFGNLENHAQVESPFKVEMKAENLIVEPAIMGIREGAGHFHIIVDGPLSPPGSPIAKNSTHIHYGNGESTTVLDLPVGEHTLGLQFAKGDHVAYDPPLIQLITIMVTKQNNADSTLMKPADSSGVMP